MILTNYESTYVAEVVLKKLDGRGGFDGWWGSIDDDIRDEIMVELGQVIQKAVHECVAGT